MWLVFLLITSALAAPAPWYGAPPVETAWWTETSATVGEVRRLARAAELRQIVLESASGEGIVVWTPRRDHLKEIDAVMLELLSLVLRVEQGVGLEMDMLGPAGALWRGLTARWSPEGVLTVQQGPPLKLIRPAPIHREQLRERYRLGPIVDGDLSWTPHELGLLEAALATLTEAERARMAGVSFHRVSAPSQAPMVAPPAGTQLEAMTLGGSFGLRVEVFAGGLTSGFRFVGPVDKPAPFALHVLVHELAHVIAAAPDTARVQRLVAELESYEADRARHAAAVAHYNEQIVAAEGGRAAGVPSNERLHQQLEQLERDQAALQARRRVLDISVAQLEAVHLSTHPAVVAWLAFLDGRPAPTLYGREAEVEGFADAFALWKLDPEALERAVPGATQWFESGAHLDAR